MSEENDMFGFKTRTYPPPVNEMENFENDPVESEMEKDIKEIRNSKKSYILADKACTKLAKPLTTNC